MPEGFAMRSGLRYLFVVGVTIVILGTPLDSSPISTPAPETLYSAGRVNFAKIRNHMCNVNTSVRRLMSTLAGKTGPPQIVPIRNATLVRMLHVTNDSRLSFYSAMNAFRKLFENLAAVSPRRIAKRLNSSFQAIGAVLQNVSANCREEISHSHIDCSALTLDGDPLSIEVLNDDDLKERAFSLASRLYDQLRSLQPNSCIRNEGKRKKRRGNGKKNRRRGHGGRKRRRGSKKDRRHRKRHRQEKTDPKETRNVSETETDGNAISGRSDQGLPIANAKDGQVDVSIENKKSGNSRDKAQKRGGRRRRKEKKRTGKGGKKASKRQRKHKQKTRRSRGKQSRRKSRNAQ